MASIRPRSKASCETFRLTPISLIAVAAALMASLSFGSTLGSHGTVFAVSIGRRRNVIVGSGGRNNGNTTGNAAANNKMLAKTLRDRRFIEPAIPVGESILEFVAQLECESNACSLPPILDFAIRRGDFSSQKFLLASASTPPTAALAAGLK